MVIPFTIRGIALANGQGILACLSFPVKVPVPSQLPQSWGGGGGGKPDRGKGWGLGSSLFSQKEMLILDRFEHLQKIVIFDAKNFSDSLAITEQKIALARKVLSNSPFPFPFPQSSQKRELVIPRFRFPQDLRE